MQKPDDVWSFLFTRPRVEGAPLFFSQVDLAAQIEKRSKGQRKERSVASSLSAFFRGERTLPEELEIYISDLISGRGFDLVSEFKRLVGAHNLRVALRRK